MASLRIVLVRTANPANIGAVARVIANMGLAGMDLVKAPDFRTLECWRTAWGATRVLEESREHPDLTAALRDCAYTVAFTRRTDEQPSLDVRAVAEEAAALGAERSAFVFGPETSGLTLDEIACCGRRAHVPSHPDQPSLNLSHAAMVAAYEYHRARGLSPPSRPHVATHADKEKFLDLLTAAMQHWGGVTAPRQRVHLRAWREFIQRADATSREMRMLTHLARTMAQARSRSAPETDQSSKPYEDIALNSEGFSIPVIKWHELLFIGAIRREGEEYVRDPSRPLPLFRIPDLFPAHARFRARTRGERIEIERIEK
jgi:tRNA/rRNA methyltransferase